MSLVLCTAHWTGLHAQPVLESSRFDGFEFDSPLRETVFAVRRKKLFKKLILATDDVGDDDDDDVGTSEKVALNLFVLFAK